jgi:hypothetical protein
MRPADIAPTRQISGQVATFRVEAFADPYRCFVAAEEGGDALSQKAGNAVGVNVIFPGGVFDLPKMIEQKFVVGVYFQGPTSTIITRKGNPCFRAVTDYAQNDWVYRWSGFSCDNTDPSGEPMIYVGGSSFATIDHFMSGGVGGGDLVEFTNVEPRPADQVPEGHPFGTWTENAAVEVGLIYGPKRSGIRWTVPQAKCIFQSFATFSSRRLCIAGTVPGSIGIELRDHCNVYAADLRAKFNVERTCGGDFTCVKVGPYCNLDTDINVYAEAARLSDDKDDWRSAGKILQVDKTGKVTGRGRFTRQDPRLLAYVLESGLDWQGNATAALVSPELMD